MSDLIAEVRTEMERRRSLGRVAAPEWHQIAKDISPKVKLLSVSDRDRFCEELLKSGLHSEGAIVCYVYRRFAKQCGAREFKLFTRWLDTCVDDWGMTDGISLWLLGAAIANEPALIAKLPPWTKSKNRWKRRAAAVALVPSARRGLLTAEILGIAQPLIPDADDMVQKGVGWLLKETYPKKPRETVRFLAPWRGKAPRLMLRYAAEKMTAADRAHILSIP
jgi:3-methyladenine DNA glycosylase AlkD